MSSEEMLSPSLSIKSQNGPKVSRLVIKKPHTLKEKCPVETRSRGLPPIESPCRQKTKGRKHSSESSRFSFNSEVTLPELCRRGSSRQRVEAGEPCAPLRSASSVKRTGSNAGEEPSETAEDFREATKEAEDQFEIFGPSRCRSLFRVPSCEFNFDEFKPPDDGDSNPSRALAQWQLWMARKKSMQDRLGRRLNRAPCDLLIQQPDRRRKVVEDKLLFHYAKIPEPDKRMGHPYQWRPDIRLRDKGRCSECDEECPQYFAVKSKSYEGIVPDVEFVGIPMQVQREKGLICGQAAESVNSPPKFWKESSYRKERSRHYRKQMKKMKPHEIEMEELIVVGSRIPLGNEEKDSERCENVPEILVTEPEEGETWTTLEGGRKSVFCLAVEGEELRYECDPQSVSSKEESRTWEVNFGVNPVGSLVEKSLRVENRGTLAVSYEWVSKKAEPTQTLDALLPKHHDPWFFFDKNSGIFVPGQIYHLKFYLRSKRSGIRTETWFLKTSPPLFENGAAGRIVLAAVVSETSSECQATVLESYIKRRVAESTAKFILQRLLHVVTEPSVGLQQMEYRSLFSRKDLFEHHNPQHFYHSKTVDDLHELFKEVFVDQQQEWDLSIASLLQSVRCHADEKAQSGLLCKISECGRKLLRPSRVSPKRDKKYKMAYQALGKMANFMEEDYDYLKSCLSHRQHLGRKYSSEFEESEECLSGPEWASEAREMEGETEGGDRAEMSSVNLLHFRTMLYLKVYHRLCEAVEQVAGILETRKLFRPWK